MCPCGSASSAAVGSSTTPVPTSTWGRASRARSSPRWPSRRAGRCPPTYWPTWSGAANRRARPRVRCTRTSPGCGGSSSRSRPRPRCRLGHRDHRPRLRPAGAGHLRRRARRSPRRSGTSERALAPLASQFEAGPGPGWPSRARPWSSRSTGSTRRWRRGRGSRTPTCPTIPTCRPSGARSSSSGPRPRRPGCWGCSRSATTPACWRPPSRPRRGTRSARGCGPRTRWRWSAPGGRPTRWRRCAPCGPPWPRSSASTPARGYGRWSRRCSGSRPTSNGRWRRRSPRPGRYPWRRRRLPGAAGGAVAPVGRDGERAALAALLDRLAEGSLRRVRRSWGSPASASPGWSTTSAAQARGAGRHRRRRPLLAGRRRAAAVALAGVLGAAEEVRSGEPAPSPWPTISGAGASARARPRSRRWDGIVRRVLDGRPPRSAAGRARGPALGRRGHAPGAAHLLATAPADVRRGAVGTRRAHPEPTGALALRRRGASPAGTPPASTLDRAGRDGDGRPPRPPSGPAVTRPLVDAWHTRSGGNPFFLVELARLGARPATDVRPRSATSSTAAWPELPDRDRRRPWRRPRSSAGRSGPRSSPPPGSGTPTTSTDDLEAARAAGLVVERGPESYAFAHALTRDAVYADRAPAPAGPAPRAGRPRPRVRRRRSAR